MALVCWFKLAFRRSNKEVEFCQFTLFFTLKLIAIEAIIVKRNRINLDERESLGMVLIIASIV